MGSRKDDHDHDLSGINFCLKGRNKLNILGTFFKNFVKMQGFGNLCLPERVSNSSS